MEASSSTRKTRIILFLVTAAVIVVLDLWTKDAIFRLLQVESVGTPPRVQSQVEYVIIPGYFDLEANYNYGAFHGWFSEHTEWLAVLSATALAVLAAFFVVQFRKGKAPSIPFTIALGLLWAGTLGNLYDRAVLGAVRDWIKWYYVSDGRAHVWPNFNVADSAICVGVSLWILLEILQAFAERRARKAQETT